MKKSKPNILAIIPARSGSKGLKNKNIKRIIMDRRKFLGLSIASLTVAGCGGDGNSPNFPPAVTPDVPDVISSIPDAEWQTLANNLTGDLILPTDGSQYNNARLVFNSRFDHILPQGIVHCENEKMFKQHYLLYAITIFMLLHAAQVIVTPDIPQQQDLLSM